MTTTVFCSDPEGLCRKPYRDCTPDPRESTASVPDLVALLVVDKAVELDGRKIAIKCPRLAVKRRDIKAMRAPSIPSQTSGVRSARVRVKVDRLGSRHWTALSLYGCVL